MAEMQPVSVLRRLGRLHDEWRAHGARHIDSRRSRILRRCLISEARSPACTSHYRAV
jgi:hypothetical protein